MWMRITIIFNGCCSASLALLEFHLFRNKSLNVLSWYWPGSTWFYVVFGERYCILRRCVFRPIPFIDALKELNAGFDAVLFRCGDA
ncbi:hypothetical protein CWC46_16905 [Prodigiosinella confusarubida]|uniref:Uncharacterized protein n=1 Tax=Serratia sp. (strain ATCC 39006) TaxID=104623 RepID=A0A2I5TM78_SERS3|nr:hypothetical protein [Serratia sp. ATCC 39006]AUH01335.1 hypothetical protein CWC46_16905 [Serratia sp. ATCC 39006]AUH05656.1 hypothetical protein Ser39006_016905 [Serratia sp. ATCC 39006]